VLVSRAALPGLSYVDHVGLSVPDLEEAVGFFRDVLGAEELYRSSRGGDPRAMVEAFGVAPESSCTLAMLRLPPNLNLELFQWDGPDRRLEPPRASDVGGHHLCIYVADADAACAYLRTVPSVRVLGGVKTVGPGSPVAGTRWTYFVTPWGLRMELVERSAVVDPPGFVVPR
jgi:catechol 2,3-dioxygenase-like lactoylglutathione lyase family enzyme